MAHQEHCTVTQLVDVSGSLVGPVRLRRVVDGQRLDAHYGETLCQTGSRLQDEGWRLVAGNRVAVGPRQAAGLFAVILTYSRDH